jgi:aarF domain-containing kinase
LDVPKIEEIAHKWGIALDANMYVPESRLVDVRLIPCRFASAILLRPFQVNKNKQKSLEPEKTAYEQQVEMKKRFKTLLENEKLIPRVS